MTDKPYEAPIRNFGEYPHPKQEDVRPLTCDSRLDEIGKAMAHAILEAPCPLESFFTQEHCLTSRCLTDKGKAMLEARRGDDPEPEIRGETTFGLNPKWIDWYCRVNNTAVWKARKAGKEKLRKLQALVNRFNK